LAKYIKNDNNEKEIEVYNRMFVGDAFVTNFLSSRAGTRILEKEV